MKHIIITICLMAIFTACSNEENERPGRAVLVYMAADNNLGDNGYLTSDIREIMAGSKNIAPNDRLYIFYSKRSTPRIYQVEQGDTIRRYTFTDDTHSSDPATLRKALEWMISDVQNTNEYGLVLWGHSTGWEISNTLATSRRRAYGAESNGSIVTWMNIPDMAKALDGLPRLLFILADCCVFQCVETAYELRDNVDYIIGSPAEIPNAGASYSTVVPAFYDRSATFYQAIADNYNTNYIGNLPLSVIKTSKMEHLAQATHAAMATFVAPGEYQEMSGLIYYYSKNMIDMNDFIRSNASEEVYQTWKQQFDEVVIYKQFAAVWMTNSLQPYVNFNDFTATEDKYGGISMFVYQQPKTTFLKKLNETINQMSWYEDARLRDFDW